MLEPLASTLVAVGMILLALSPIFLVESTIASFGERITLRR